MIWATGTNDVQALTNYASIYNDVAHIASDCRNRGERLLVLVPGHFWTRTESQGTGQATANHATGAYIRQAIKQAAAGYSGGGYVVGVLDLPEVLGPELAEYLWQSPAPVTPAINTDNIHPNDIGHARIGFHAAAAALTLLTPAPEESAFDLEVPDQLCGPNFDPSASSGVVPKVSILGCKWASLDGRFTRTAGANDGALLVTFPKALAPVTRVEHVGTDGNGVVVFFRIFERGHAQEGQMFIYTTSTQTSIPANLGWRIG